MQSLIAIAISHNSDYSAEAEDSGENNPYNNKKSLVVCPSSVVGHWVGEIKRFFPGNKLLTPFNFTGMTKARRVAWNEQLAKCNIVLTSYSVLRSDVDLLEGTIWEYCILDEGHLLKNPKTGGYCSFSAL